MDKDRIHVRGTKNYGYCSDDCPKYDYVDFDATPGQIIGRYIITHYDDNYKQGRAAFFDVNPSEIFELTKIIGFTQPIDNQLVWSITTGNFDPRRLI